MLTSDHRAYSIRAASWERLSVELVNFSLLSAFIQGPMISRGMEATPHSFFLRLMRPSQFDVSTRTSGLLVGLTEDTDSAPNGDQQLKHL